MLVVVWCLSGLSLSGFSPLAAAVACAFLFLLVILRSAWGGVGPVRGLRGGGRGRWHDGVGQERLGPSYFVMSLVLGLLNSLIEGARPR